MKKPGNSSDNHKKYQINNTNFQTITITQQIIRKKKFATLRKSSTFANSKGEFSSAGSEHLPYKQGVTGSNPVTPTRAATQEVAAFLYHEKKDLHDNHSLSYCSDNRLQA